MRRRDILNIGRHLRAYEPRKDGFCPIQLRTYKNGADIKVQSGVYASVRDWETKRQRVRPGVAYAETANAELDRLENLIRAAYEKAKSEGAKYCTQYVERFIQTPEPVGESPDFIAYWRAWLVQKAKGDENGKNAYSPGTVEQMTSEINKLEAWRNPLTFADITRKSIKEYEKHLLYTLGNVPNTVQKSMRKLHQILSDAASNEIIDKNPMDGLTFHGEAPEEIEALEEWELTKIERYAVKDRPVLEKTAKLFLLQCYTGMAHSDMLTFKPEFVHEAHGKKWISKDRMKSQVNALVPLFPQSQKLLEWFDFFGTGNLPMPALATYNYNLKTLMRELDIKTKMSSHTGRKTAAMFMADEGVHIEVVSRILGHKSVETTKRWYAKIRAKRIAKETEGFTRFG